MSRRRTTLILTKAVVHYFSKKRYSSHVELGVEAWGKKRLDVLALNTKGDLVGIEVKSCAADFNADKKWNTYLDYTNRFYFAFSEKTWSKVKFQEKVLAAVKPFGIGILVLSEASGYIEVVKNAKRREVDSTLLQSLILRMAWRGGKSRRTIKQRKRFFIEKDDS